MEVNETMKVSSNLQFVLKCVGICGAIVWGYSVLIARLNTLDMEVERVQHESTLLGDLSARVMALEKFADQTNRSVEHLLSLQDAPITSDHQQFERIKYLEKEMDAVREKLDMHLIYR